MKIYGVGVLTAPGTSRVIHDFVDGPFDTSNPALIAEAKRRGFGVGEPLPEVTSGFMRLEGDSAPEGGIIEATTPPKKAPPKKAPPKKKEAPNGSA